MVLFISVLIVLYGYLVFAPLPPIHPKLPRPPHLARHIVSQRSFVPHFPEQERDKTSLVSYTLNTEPLSGSNVTKSALQQVAFTEAQAAQPTSEQAFATSPQGLYQLYTRVAARSLGEGAFALPEIACTIKNRLRVSHAALSAVLRAYHAMDVPPNPAHIETVRKVFEGELACPASWWYALSLQDTYYWRPHQRPPAKIIKQSDRKQILIFDR